MIHATNTNTNNSTTSFGVLLSVLFEQYARESEKSNPDEKKLESLLSQIESEKKSVAFLNSFPMRESEPVTIIESEPSESPKDDIIEYPEYIPHELELASYTFAEYAEHERAELESLLFGVVASPLYSKSFSELAPEKPAPIANRERFESFDEKAIRAELALERAKAARAFTRSKFKASKATPRPADNMLVFKKRIEHERARSLVILHADFPTKAALADEIAANTARDEKNAALFGTLSVESKARKFAELFGVFKIQYESELASRKSKPAPLVSFDTLESSLSNCPEYAALLAAKVPTKIAKRALLKLYGGRVNKKTGELCGGVPTAYELYRGENMPQSIEDIEQELALELWRQYKSGELESESESEPATLAPESLFSCFRLVYNSLYRFSVRTNELKLVHLENELESVDRAYIDEHLESIDRGLRAFLKAILRDKYNRNPEQVNECLTILFGLGAGYTQAHIAEYLGKTQQAIHKSLNKYCKPALTDYTEQVLERKLG